MQAFALSMVGSMSTLASLATFFQAKRCESVLSHFPSHIGSHFCDLLAGSSFEGPHLFNDEVLTKILAEPREDSVVSANLALVKAVSFLVFRAAKSGQKVSFDQSSAATPATASRDRGRGSISDQSKKGHPSSPASSSSFQGHKHKAFSPLQSPLAWEGFPQVGVIPSSSDGRWLAVLQLVS